MNPQSTHQPSDVPGPIPTAEDLLFDELPPQPRTIPALAWTDDGQDETDIDDEVSDFCVAVSQACAEHLLTEVSDAEVDDFLARADSPPPLPARLQARLDAQPDLLPGTAGRLELYRQGLKLRAENRDQNVKLVLRSEPNLRSTPGFNVPCHGRESEIAEGVQYLKQDGCRILLISGAPGIGKTTLACGLAHRFVKQCADELKLAASNVRFFDCVGLGTQREFSGLLFSQLSGRSAANLPEDMRERFEALRRRLVFYLNGLQTMLWTFDGLDDYLRAVKKREEQITLTAELIGACARTAPNLKVIITLRDEIEKPLLQRLFGDHFLTQKLELRTDSTRPAGRRRGAKTAAHPLAMLLVNAIHDHRHYWPEQQLPLFNDSEICPAVLLEEACRASWNGLAEEDRRILQICRELPGGVWTAQGDGGQNADCIDWANVFQDEQWLERLGRLRDLEWLTEQTDRADFFGSSTLYRLRPALNAFIKKQTQTDEYLRINRRLVGFWAKNLKRWSHTIAGRLTDLVEPRLPQAAGRRALLLAEENARYLIDISRLNWLLAYRRISQCVKARDLIAMHYFYLRGSICYCRMTGSLTLFEGLVERGLKKIRKFSPDPAAPAWRRMAWVVYQASCHDMRGRTRRRLGKPVLALASLNEAEEILRRLPMKFARVQHNLAWTLTEHGRVCHEFGRWQEAGRQLKVAIRIRRRLVADLERKIDQQDTLADGQSAGDLLEKKKNQQLRYLATSYNIYGNLLNDRFEWIEAEKFHRDALSIRQGLEDNRPYGFQRYIANCHNDYANSLFYQGKYELALEHYLKALAIRERLVPHPENGLGQYVARSYNNIGNTYRKLGEWGKARQCLERAVNIYRACILEFPARFNDLLARTLTNLGRIHYHQGSMREALAVLEESDRLHMVSANSVATPFKWVETCNSLAMVCLQIHDDKYALKILERAENLLKKNAALCAKSHDWYQAMTLHTKAQVLLRGCDPSAWQEAEGLLRRCGQLRQDLQRKSNIGDALDLPITLNWHDLGSALRRMKVFGEAEIYLWDALRLRRRIAASNPKYVERLVARSAVELAALYTETGRCEASSALYQEARTIFHKLHQANPRGFKKELSQVNAALERLARSGLAILGVAD